MVTREELYELVWSMPMVKVAEQFEVSGSYLARVCTELMVPRPDRGYWAKLSVGKAPPRPVLPEQLAGFAVAWSRTKGFQAPTLPTPRQAPRPGSSRPIRPVVGTHGLIRGARELILVGSTLNDDEHLRPSKQLIVDITASHSGLDKALGFTNDLFNALESAGHRVVIAPATAQFRRGRIEAKELTPKNESAHDSYETDRRWSPYRPTVALVDSVAFGLAVIEMTEPVEMRYVNGKYIRESEYVPPRSRSNRHYTSTSTKNLPCGRLRLVVYAPYGAVSWSTSFEESKGRTLTPDIPRIVRAIEREVAPMLEKLKEAERQAELRRLEWLAWQEQRRQEDDRRSITQSIKESREHLEQVIQAWSKVVSLEQFFHAIEDRAQTLPADECQRVLERLRFAREFVGTQNPMEFFLSWKTPTERYVPLAQRGPALVAGDRETAMADRR